MIEKDILLTLTYLVGAGELALAIFFWVTHSNSEIRKVMALLAFSASIWAITNGLTSYTNPSALLNFWLGLLFISGAVIVTTLLYFGLIFPYKRRPVDNLHILLLYIPVAIFSYMALFTKTIVASYAISPLVAGYVHPGPLFNLYEIYVSIIFLFSLGILLSNIRHSDGMHRKNSTIVFWSVLLGGLPAIIFNLWFVFFGLLVNPLIPVLFTALWVGGTTYIIIKN